MGYKFLLSENEKKEILNKHNSYKNYLNEENVTPSIMDIQLKLIQLGFEELLGPTKADNKFGKNTCNAILSALSSLKEKLVSGSNESIPKPTNGQTKDETIKDEEKIANTKVPANDQGIDVAS